MSCSCEGHHHQLHLVKHSQTNHFIIGELFYVPVCHTGKDFVFTQLAINGFQTFAPMKWRSFNLFFIIQAPWNCNILNIQKLAVYVQYFQYLCKNSWYFHRSSLILLCPVMSILDPMTTFTKTTWLRWWTYKGYGCHIRTRHCTGTGTGTVLVHWQGLVIWPYKNIVIFWGYITIHNIYTIHTTQYFVLS